MAGTFEETVGRELDALYRAALFFCGGNGERAERVLTSAVLSAFLSWRSSGGSTPALEGVERHLARIIMKEAHRRPEGGRERLGRLWRFSHLRRASGADTAGEEPSLEVLMQAALDLEAPARIAFWYAVLERRDYAGIGGILACTPREVARLVRDGQHAMHMSLGSLNLMPKESRRGRESGTGSGHGLP